MSVPAFGVCFHREQPAADIAGQAQAVERAGYDELWVIEDLFYTAGPSLAAAALTATDSLGVGIGIMPAAVRNPVATAMEIATLASMAPGRFHAGIGHGVQDWMAQIGAREASPVTLLEESIVAVRRLLAGERFSSDGRYVSLDDVALVTPPDPAPPVSAGVRGPRSLQMAGRCADGTILAELCSPAYLRWAHEQIDAGGGGASHRITVFCSIAVSADGGEARRAMTRFVAGVFANAPVGVRMLPFYPELRAKAEASSWPDAIAAMPVDWWSDLGPIGTPEDAAAYLTAMSDAGADALAVFPDPHDPVSDARSFAEQVLEDLR